MKSLLRPFPSNIFYSNARCGISPGITAGNVKGVKKDIVIDLTMFAVKVYELVSGHALLRDWRSERGDS